MTADNANMPTVGASRYSKGIVTIAGVKYRCFSLKQFHTVNEFSIGELVVVQDTDKDGVLDNSNAIYDNLTYVKKGEALTVSFLVTEPKDPTVGQKSDITEQRITLFTGKFLGMGPIWFTPNSLRITVWAVHPIGMLDWAATGLDAVHGFGFDDYKLAITPASTEEIVPYMKGPYDKSAVAKDLWKGLIKPELIALCNANRFNTPNAPDVAKYLADDKSDISPIPLALTIGDPEKVILDVRRTLMSSAMGRRSLWDNLRVLASVYKFNIICRANDFMVVPAVPALGKGTPDIVSSDHYPLRCVRFSEQEEYNSLARQIVQAIGMLRGPGGLSNFFDAEARKRREEVRLPKDEKIVAGTSFTLVPRFLDFGMDPFFNTGITLGLKSDKLASVGYKIKSAAVSTETLNKKYNGATDKHLKKYTDVVMNEEQYSGTTAVYKGPLNWNICPGNTVQLEPPTYYKLTDTKLSGVSFFGRVWSVATTIEPKSRRAGTYLVLTHVRNNQEQDKIEMPKHPMYDKRWVSAPLLDIANFTEKMQYA